MKGISCANKFIINLSEFHKAHRPSSVAATALPRILWTAVLVLGVLVRAQIAGSEVSLSGDAALRYEPIAQNLVAGRGFSKSLAPPYVPDDFDQPGYPYFLATTYQLTEAGANKSSLKSAG